MTILLTRVLQKVVHAEHSCKFYRLQLAQDSTGTLTLIQEWGRIGRAGKRVSTPYPTEAEGMEQLAKLFELKQKRGYTLLPDTTEIPGSYEALPCPWCALLQPGQAHQVAALTHSQLYLATTETGSPALLFVYRHHIPDLAHLDAASLLGFLAEIRRVQGQAKEFLQQHLQGPWVQLFGGSEHLWCQLVQRQLFFPLTC
ncbi:MAG: WGR domain-containing protein [Polynucleobacter sp.]|nr:WGR domain-containing protein [Polynucleobacter sp.]